MKPFCSLTSLVLTLTMLLAPFTFTTGMGGIGTSVSAAPVEYPVPPARDDSAPDVLPDYAQPPTPEPPKSQETTRNHERAETALTTQAPAASTSQTSTTPPLSGMAIRLQRATFDPLIETPDLSPNLTLAAYPGDGSGYYLIQFKGPILSEWKEALGKAGAVFHDYVPRFAYVVRMDETTAARVRALEAVRWVGLYQPAFRLSTDLDDVVTDASDETVRIIVRSFTGEPVKALAQQLESLGGQIHARGDDSGGGIIFQLELSAASIPAVASLSGVAWIEPWAEPRLANEITRSPLIFNKDGVEDRLGLYGVDQIVVVGDTGVSTGDEATVHQDFRGRVYTGTWGGGTCGTWRDDNGHGTHVAGSVLGSGVMDGAVTSTHSYAGTNAGIAPEALLWAWGFCTDWSGLPDTDPYNDYYGVMYDDDPRVRTNTNSWSYKVSAGTYDAFSRETDRFIWDHQDMVVLFAASNDGTDANADGIVDQDSMGVPAGSKNIITIGASENYRMSGGYNPGGDCDTWGNCWPGDFPADPVNSDRLSDDPSGMVAFSSRGPVDDGRLKPDVVAPGSNIVSTRDDSTTGWGVYDANYIYMGGTSMAAPLSAGGGAIVREFYSVTYGITPTAALVKATLINGAYDMTPGQYRDEVPDGSQDDVIRRPDIHQGWGRVDLFNSLIYDPPRALWFYEDGTGLNTSEEYSATLTVNHDTDPFRVTLVWADYPGLEATHGALVNDLDLEVVAPNGTTYYGNDIIGDGLLDGDVDHVNNVEGVDFNPLTGNYVIKVKGYNTPQGPQPFALVVSGDMGEANGIVYDAATLRGIEGARIEVTLQPTNTTSIHASGIGGYFGMPTAAGVYSVTALAYGYRPNTVTATVPVSAQVNIPLDPAPFYTVEGIVTDANTGYPLRAHISVAGDPFDPPPPGNETWSDTTTGHYSLTLASYVTYTFIVEAVGYDTEAHVVGPLTSDTTEDFALDPDLAACTAPGYEVFGLIEDFENGVPPAGWSVVDNAGNGLVWTTIAGSGESGNYTGGSGDAASCSSDVAGTLDFDTELRTPVIGVASLPTTTLHYLANYQNLAGSDYLTVGISVDGGAWQTVLSWNENHGTFRGTPGEAVALDLSTQLAGATDLQISWRYYDPNSDDWDWYAQIDQVHMDGCRVAANAAILEPDYIYAEGCPCTPQVHELTFINHTGLTDTVNITYTTSPSVTVLDIPADLGVVPDGGVRPFETVIKIDSSAPPNATVYVTVTASLAGSPAYSATTIIEKHTMLFYFDPDGWQLEPTGDVPTDTVPSQWGQGAVGTNTVATGEVGYYVTGGLNGYTCDEFQMYDTDTLAWTQLATIPQDVFGAVASWIGGHLYVSGGYVGGGFTGITDTQVYDPNTDTWDNTTPPDIPASGGRGGASGGKGTCSSGTGECHFHVGGGPDSSFANSTLETWEYDPSTSTWTQLDDRPAGDTADGVVLGGGVGCLGYIFQGGDYRGYDNFFRLDATQLSGSQWITMTDIPAEAGKMTPAMVCKEDDRAVYLVGGDPDDGWSRYNTTVYRYDIDTDTWSGPLEYELNTAQTGSVALHMYDRLWTFGGTRGSGALDPPPHESLEEIMCPVCDCRLELEKEGPQWVYQDDVATYLIRLINTGELTATAVLTDEIPSGVDYAGNLACGGMTCWYDSGDDAVYLDDEVPPYEAITITFDFSVTASTSTGVVNTATVEYCGGELFDAHEFHVQHPPGFTWAKQVSINGGAWQDYTAGPFDVAPGNTVEISETLAYTGTFPHFAYIFENWAGYPLEFQDETHSAGAVAHGADWFDWGVTLTPGKSATLNKTFQVTGAGTITISEELAPEGVAPYSRTVTLLSSSSEPAWEKQVYVNGVPTDTFPVTVFVSDTVQIVDRVWVTYTGAVAFTLVETWTPSLELTGSVAFSAGGVTSGSNWLTWEAPGVASNTWHVLTKTFHVTGSLWTTGLVTETLWVEGADPQPDDRVLTFTHGCEPVTDVDFTWLPPNPETGDTVVFTATYQPPYAGAPLIFEWGFDDGGKAVGNPVYHTFLVSDTYSVAVTATNPCGGPVWMSHDVVVSGTTFIPSYGVELMPQMDTGAGDPGDLVAYTLWVTNSGNVADTFNLAPNGNVWTTAVDPTSVNLPPTGTQQIAVTVTVTDTARCGDSDVATIIATSQASPTVSASSVLTTSANPVYGVDVTPPTDAQSGTPGETVTHTLRVTNTGNCTDTFDAAVSGDTWTTGVDPITFTLATGVGLDVDVTVTITDTAKGGDSDTVTVTVTSDNDPSQSDSSLLTTTVAIYYTLTVATDGTGTGVVTPTVGTHSYISGTTVWLTATASAGSTFDGWSGDAGGLTNPVSVTMDSDKQVTATFNIAECVAISGADFTFAPPEPVVGDTVTFTGTVTAGDSPLTYTWNFGDDSALQMGNPIAHAFPVTSTRQVYTVMMTVTNPCPGQGTASQAVTVLPRYVYLPLVMRSYSP
ncbi:MAG: S8 family serine peptidase [Chloroflexota bacterium]|nr:S8 family serine peptidase [Chloroflexota bacterium]